MYVASKLKVCLAAFSLIFCVVITLSQTTPLCPPCFNNQEPFSAAHGLVNGRRVINVAIRIGSGSNSWATLTGEPNSLIGNAAAAAMSEWNNRADTSAQTPAEQHLPYYFSTTSNINLVDIIIEKMPVRDPTTLVENAPGELLTGTTPYTLRIREDMITRLSSDDLAGLFKHELGHGIGLSNSHDCTGDTIMGGMSREGENYRLHVNQVQINDVYRVNAQFKSDLRASVCTDTDPRNNKIGEGGTVTPLCIDQDNDGFTPCDGDCNDTDPSRNPGAPEICGDGVDGDCDGAGDTTDPNCNSNVCDVTISEISYCKETGGRWYGPPICGCDYPSPIVVDILGNGFALTDNAGGVRFDLNGDGVKESLSWTAAASDDAWLALDRDGNGFIETGRELFGNYTPQPESPNKNGFLALTEYDKPPQGGNGDGLINKQDPIFPSLRLWQDANHNGVSEAGELHTLKQLGLKSIDLDYTQSKRTDRYGNRFRYRAKVKDTHDAQLGRWAWDVFLVAGP